MDRSRSSAESPGPTAVASMGGPPTSSNHPRRSLRTARMSPYSYRSSRSDQFSAPSVSFTPSFNVSSPSLAAAAAAAAPSAAASLAAATASEAHSRSGTRGQGVWSSSSSSATSRAAAAAVESSQTPSRRSTRKRKAPELLSASAPNEDTPRKRKAESSSSSCKKSPSAKKPAAKKRAPGRLKTDPDEETMDATFAACSDNNCCICMTEPEPEELAKINGCDHLFCFGCIEKWADRENTCPLCKKRFVKIERVHKHTKRQKGGSRTTTPKSSVKVKNKSQRSELAHSLALEGLFDNLGRGGISFESIFAHLQGGNRNFNTQIARIVVNGIGSSGSGGLEVGATFAPSAASASAGSAVARGIMSSSSAAAASASGGAAVGASSSSSARSGVARAPPAVSSQLRAAQAASAGMPSISVHRGFFSGFGSDGEDSDDEDNEDGGGFMDDEDFRGFVEAVRDRRGFSISSSSFPASVRMHATPRFAMSQHPAAAVSSPPRSYASNQHDLTAGASAENALEIQDSDDDDDEVEIVGTRRTRSASAGRSPFASVGSYRGM